MNQSPTVVMLLVLLLSTGCSAPAVEVTEILNHGLCKTLRQGVSRVAFADLAGIRGTQLLSTTEDVPEQSSPFSDVTLVAVSNGSQPTPGYAFELESVSGDVSEVRLDYRWRTPPADAVMAQMVTSPCSVVQIQSATPPAAVSAWLDGRPLGKLSLTE